MPWCVLSLIGTLRWRLAPTCFIDEIVAESVEKVTFSSILTMEWR